MIQKPLTERLSNRSASNLELDPDLVAASFGFGAVYQPASPLADNPTPTRQFATATEIPLIDTRAKRAEPKPSLFSIVMKRLDSLTPLSKKDEQLVTEMKASAVSSLAAIDAFISEIEQARFIAIETRWETIRAEGRKLSDSLPELQRQLAEARQYANQSGEKKGRAKADAEQAQRDRWVMQKWTWATKEELQAADEKLEAAKSASQRAQDRALSDLRRLAVVESKIASLTATLESYETELQRLSLELNGAAFFDAEFGLSTEPRFYKETQVTGSQR